MFVIPSSQEMGRGFLCGEGRLLMHKPSCAPSAGTLGKAGPSSDVEALSTALHLHWEQGTALTGSKKRRGDVFHACTKCISGRSSCRRKQSLD